MFKVIATTDHKYIGLIFNHKDGKIVLSEDGVFTIEKVITTPDFTRFVTNNYIIDAVENTDA